MKQANHRLSQKGSATVTLSSEQIILCRLAGNVTGAVVQGSMQETRRLAEVAQTKGPVRLLIDVNGVTKQTSEARREAKQLNDMGFERIAVSGGSRAVTMIGRYVAKAGGMSDYTRFFRTQRAALAWLEHGDNGHSGDMTRNRRRVIALLLAIIGVSVLTGWLLDVSVLRSFVPILKPTNPLTAVTFLAFALCLALMRPGWQRQPIRRGVILFTVAWSLLLSVTVALRFAFQIDIPLDKLLFNHQLEAAEAILPGRNGLMGGLLLAVAGLMLLILAVDQRRAWQTTGFYVLSSVIFVPSIVVLTLYSFGYHAFYDWDSLAMSLPTTIALLLLVHVLTLLGRPTKAAATGIRIFNTYWQAWLLTLLLVLATGASWHQTKHDLEDNIADTAHEAFTQVNNALQSRLLTYTDSLNGYQGLYSGSSDVSPTEFRNYFVNSGLATNYPGFSAITYIATVPDSQKAAFIVQTRQRATPDFPSYKMFSIFPESSATMHYPLLYVQPSTNATLYGFDLATEDVRRQALEAARDEGQPKASGIINLNASRGDGQPVNNGFFLSSPVYAPRPGVAKNVPETMAERQQHIQGFVIAYFQNTRLFGDIFKNHKEHNAAFTVTDAQTDTQMYRLGGKTVPAEAAITQTDTFTVGGRTWRLSMQINEQYGKVSLYRTLPLSVLSSGLVLSALAGSLVVAQLRRREQALELAAKMTEDLSSERNRAIATQQKDEAILSSIGDAVFAIDVDKKITLFNQACERISGYTAQEAIGHPYTDVLKFRFEKTNKPNDDFIARALSGQLTSMKNHTILIRKDGRSVAVADSAAPIYDARGDKLGAIVVFRDVSKEQELDRAKTEFVSLASHQLRTPLSAINWYGELLLSGDAGKLRGEQQQYVQEIYEGNQRMIDLVNALLDVSRLDLGKLSNQPSPTDMKELAASLEKELMTSIQGKRLTFRKQIQASLPLVTADPKLLRMITQNLLSNAVKYTPNGGAVHLTMRTAADGELRAAKLPASRPYFFMSVSDTGYGIPKVQQSKIFSKLFRADNVRVLDVEGTGLGLYIVREVVEKLGGRVWFTSIESAGSTFYVLIPYKTKSTSTDDSPASAAKT